MRRSFLTLAAAISFATAGQLQQSIDAGFTNTTGNSKTTNLNAKYALHYQTTGYADQQLDAKFSLAAFYAENDGQKSNEEYTSSLDLEQFIYNGWLGYFSFDWLRNPDFKNYDGKYEFGLGAGKEIYKTESSSLKLKLGAGYNILDFADETSTDTFASLLQELDYTNQLNEVSLLYFNLKANEGLDDFSENYEISGVLGMRFDLDKRVHLTLEEQVTYDNLPPAGFKKTDTKSIVRLGLSF